MADRRATNKYYPVEWEPKHGSINKFQGSHPLRARASKIDQGILVIRFEMPWNVFCTGCQRHIPKGVRFNADKTRVGKYFTTDILSFKMKCPACPQIMEIQTDPQNRDYACIDGLKKREMEWDVKESDEMEKVMQLGELESIQSDPIRRLEHREEDQEFAETKHIHLQELHEISEIHYKDDYATSQLLRSRMRSQKKDLAGLKNESKSLGLNSDFLLPKSDVDRVNSMNLVNQYRNKRVDARTTSQNTRRKIKSGSIFDNKNQALQKCIKNGVSPALFVDKHKVEGSSHPAKIKKEKNGIGMAKKSLAVDLKKRTTL